ncbi:MAG: hypothetical protein M9947_02455 [Thermomicrobiales bacterium]|nr:hypothetical protein [Thermomicrobiales bacterium]
MEHATRTKVGSEERIVRVVRVLGFFFGVQMIEIPKEFIEPMDRRQKLVQITQVIFPELAGRVAERLEQLGDRWIFGIESLVLAWQPNAQQPGTVRMLTGNEGCAARRAGLFTVGVGEANAFLADTVDVGCLISHHARVVGGNIPVPDVIPHDDQNVRAVAARTRLRRCVAGLRRRAGTQ